MSHDSDDRDDPGTTDRTTESEPDQTKVFHEWDQSEHPSVALVEAVAAATDRTTTDLPPLYRHIDADALDALLTGDQPSAVSISFRYADTDIRMRGDGTIEIWFDCRSGE